ncbi:MAG TPA: F0F1 ATP synthase subunit delta [Acidimicrobiales bacterium]|jgi:F-type H+-transporting ATPase subunit delta|nr:F0F1 ATP synthase subunit delta [Acidimicrobiales bacterium]
MNAALQGYLAAVEESLAEAGALADAAAELRGVAELVDAHTELALAINDGSVPVSARRAVLDDLLDGKVRPEVRRLVHQAVTVVPPAEVQASFHWLAARVAAAAASGAGTRLPEEEPILGRLASRNRVWGYAAAVLETLPTADLEEVEDQLFRFARTVEGNRPLRRALGDRDLPVAVRQEVIADLLGDRVLPATRRLAAYAVRGGRARDILATLDGLVEEAARARGWRVARVKAADEVDEARRGRMGEALGRLTGAPVELQVAIDPQLLGGVVVQIGDLLVDGTTRHRLDELREHLLVSGTGPYATPQGREPADG